MYSLLPAMVSLLFLMYGFYVIYVMGLNHITKIFLFVCLGTFSWQFTWAILFQIQDEALTTSVIKVGWLLMLFLPTSLYQFLIELTGRYQDRKYVYISYAICTAFSLILITTDYIIDGAYTYYYGFYPKAGPLHPLHILQTFAVVTRGFYITYRKQRSAQASEKIKYQYCIASLCFYFLAAVDYVCNYGVELYPPGVIFIAISLGVAIAATRHQVVDNNRMIASSIAHEMRTPLATLRAQSTILFEHLPELVNHYKQTKPVNEQTIPEPILSKLTSFAGSMRTEARTINEGIDHLLAITSYEFLDKRDFYTFSAQQCVEEAILRLGDDGAVSLNRKISVYSDFTIFASKEYLVFVIINLIKNARESIRQKGKGHINIYIYSDKEGNRIEVTDTGSGIDKHVLPHIFDKFFTTKPRGPNLGIGLAFCQAVMRAFGGTITCESTAGSHTTFRLSFKPTHTMNTKED